ncbi:MAG TPA: hypothetical protein VEX62_12865, partial [Candidatus Limnocylindrales bacterium]|nr:hypothetical protein [Candidatus Limnocylindrales bacterium]
MTIVAGDSFEFDARGQRIGRSLAAEGHRVRVLALADAGAITGRTTAVWGPIPVTFLTLDGRITSVFRPLPQSARRAIGSAIGLDPEATILPADLPRGADIARHPLRRMAEIGAHLRRIGPWADAIAAAAPDTDVFHTQSITALPAVQAAAGHLGARYVYDYADIQTDGARMARMPRPIRSLARGFESRWARGASARLAASSGLASIVERRTHIRPAVVLNCPPAWRHGEDEPPRFDRIREALAIPTERPIVLHHGQLKPGRGIEELVAASSSDAMARHDPAIVIMGFGRLESYVREAAARLPDRLHVLPPVPPDELLEWIASADVAYLGIPPVTPNIRLTLPNKLF